MIDDRKTRTGKSACATKTYSNRCLKWGERPVGGAGRSWGVGKFKKDAVEEELSGLVRGTDQAQEDQHGEHRDAGYDNPRRPRSF
jgi:hypothetical protein